MVPLENVAAFVRSDDGQVLQWLVGMLIRDDLYKVWHRVLCTSDNGLPQTRKRWFLVAVRSDRMISEFVWPEVIEMLPLSVVLGPRSHSASVARRPGIRQLCHKHLNKTITTISNGTGYNFRL